MGKPRVQIEGEMLAKLRIVTGMVREDRRQVQMDGWIERTPDPTTYIKDFEGDCRRQEEMDSLSAVP